MFTVYSKPNCPFCDQAKALLEQRGEVFEVINIDVGQQRIDGAKYISRDEFFSRLPAARTVPQIIRHTDNSSMIIGGFAELKQLMTSVHA